MSKKNSEPVYHDRPLTRQDAVKEYAREKAAEHDGSLTPEQQKKREENMLLAAGVALRGYIDVAKQRDIMPHVDLDSDTTKWFTQVAEMGLADTLFIHGGVQDVKKFAKSIHKDIAHDLERDELTGVFKRKELETILKSEKYAPKATIFIDALDFRKINKKYTHDTGNEVLKMITDSISSQARDNDLVGRWGGDEFVVVIRESRNQDEDSSEYLSEAGLEDITERIHKSLNNILKTAQLNDQTGASSKPSFSGYSLKITGTHEDGSKEEFNVDPEDIKISVGGVLWNNNQTLEHNLSRAEKLMKKQKHEQHEAKEHHE